MSLLGCERIPYSIMESIGKEGGCGRKRSESLRQMEREHSIIIKIQRKMISGSELPVP